MDQQINVRIKEIMESAQMSPANFASIIGVTRSNLAHIFSGRNHPSFNMLEKILKAFPEVRAEWLITGMGAMTKSESAENIVAQVPTNHVEPKAESLVQADLFSNGFPGVPTEHQIDSETEESATIADNDITQDVFSDEDIEEETETPPTPSYPGNLSVSPAVAGLRPVTSPNTSKSARYSPRNSKSDANTQGNSSDKHPTGRKKVKKIVFFYEDKSFEEYFPE